MTCREMEATALLLQGGMSLTHDMLVYACHCGIFWGKEPDRLL